MNVNLEYYKIFYFVAKNKNITNAAKELNITQPAISRMLKTLEGQLNTILFIREKRGVRFTKEGKELYSQIKDSIETIITAEENFKSLINNCDLKIASNSYLINNYLINNINVKTFKNKNITFFDTDKFTDLNELLANDIVDFALVTNNYSIPTNNNIKYMEIGTLNMCLVANEQINVSSETLNKYTIALQEKNNGFGKYVDKFLKENDIKFEKTIKSDNYENLISFVKKGIGIGFLIKESIETELEFHSLYELEFDKELPSVGIGILYKDSNEQKLKNILNILE